MGGGAGRPSGPLAIRIDFTAPPLSTEGCEKSSGEDRDGAFHCSGALVRYNRAIRGKGPVAERRQGDQLVGMPSRVVQLWLARRRAAKPAGQQLRPGVPHTQV